MSVFLFRLIWGQDGAREVGGKGIAGEGWPGKPTLASAGMKEGTPLNDRGGTCANSFMTLYP